MPPRSRGPLLDAPPWNRDGKSHRCVSDLTESRERTSEHGDNRATRPALPNLDASRELEIAMTNTSREDNGWEVCPPGTLVEYARRAKTAQRNRAILRLAGEVGAAVALFLLVVWLAPWGNREREFDYGGISCRDVQSKMQPYMMGALAADERERIRLHLAQCPRCQELMKKMPGNAAVERSWRYVTPSANLGNRAATGGSEVAWEQRERGPVDFASRRLAAADLSWTSLRE